MDLKEKLIQYCGKNKDLSKCSTNEIYFALLALVKELSAPKSTNAPTGKKKVYYISAEFLIGKLLSNNLINLGIYDEIEQILANSGHNICDIEQREPEPSLGNGGLGRLAACFLDSMATLNINGDGIGLNYHFGLFKQEFSKNRQNEKPNPWIEKNSWLTKTNTSYTVPFKGFKLKSILYDIAITGYSARTNKLHLFDVESVSEKIVKRGINFDKTAIEKNLTLFLYPDDSDDNGRLLRIYQQYFMVSNAAQYILDECITKGCTLHNLDDYAAIQINDTHPALIIPELIRLLTERGISEDEAVNIVTKTCAYTNHTILSEALEKWPMDYLKQVVPHLLPIIKTLDKRVRSMHKNKGLHIIDKQKRVHMAHIAIHFTHSTNGVAALHTDILKQSELSDFYKIYPKRFNNKTNGITFRRWLLHCNKALTRYLSELIGNEYKTNALALKKLEQYQNDEVVLNKLLHIKNENKKALIQYLKETQNIVLPENAIFDIQIKRLHEYKRQQLNLLYLIDKYFEIKSGKLPKTPIVAIFGAKAAPAYTIAKDIIHAILCLQQIIDSDEQVKKHLRVVMIENYNVTKAEMLIPACDISEQISLASKEASGTGNMKFMLNGAVTLGTMDGANVEIAQLVGDESIFTFGKSSDEIIAHYKNADYISKHYYEQNAKIRRAVDFLIGDEMFAVGTKLCLRRLHKELLVKDYFMTLIDFDEYLQVKEKALTAYNDKQKWAKMMLMNIANAGHFSSDRTIAQYNEDIWHV